MMIGIYSIYNSRRTILSNHCTTVIEKSTKKVKKKVFPQNPNIFSVGMGFHCKLPDFIAQNIIRDLRMNFELWVLWVPKLIPWQWHQPNTNKIGTNKIMAEFIYVYHFDFYTFEIGNIVAQMQSSALAQVAYGIRGVNRFWRAKYNI